MHGERFPREVGRNWISKFSVCTKSRIFYALIILSAFLFIVRKTQVYKLFLNKNEK